VNSRRITLVIAVVVAIAAGLLTVRYLDSVQHNAQPAVVETRTVVIASRDIRAHEKISPEMLTKVQKTTDQVEPGSLSDPKAAEGDVSLISIPEGAPVTATKIGVPASIGITGKLKPGLRAISIPVDFVKSVSALVEPGDRVDVLASAGRGKLTRTIIRGAVVLAVNSALEPEAQANPNNAQSGQPAAAPGSGPVAVTLGVTPDQANALTYADLNATLRLALRSPSEPVRAFPAQELQMDQPDGARPTVPAPVSVPAPSAMPSTAPTAKPTPGILVIEGSDIVGGVR
jgi:pilus assembly protein CpaB